MQSWKVLSVICVVLLSCVAIYFPRKFRPDESQKKIHSHLKLTSKWKRKILQSDKFEFTSDANETNIDRIVQRNRLFKYHKDAIRKKFPHADRW